MEDQAEKDYKNRIDKDSAPQQARLAAPGKGSSAEKLGALAGQRSQFGRSVGLDDEDDAEVEAQYDFEAMVAVDKAEQLVRNMSFNIDISKLYALEKTCIANQANPYCPVLLKVTNEDLRE